MPTSSHFGKTETVKWFKDNEHNITRILDIGAGSGTYPKLIKGAGICKDAEWVGVEVWEPYINQFNLTSLYSKIVVEDARKINWSALGRFTVASAGGSAKLS